ncbi:tonB-system energizer ExbB [Kaistia sp. 32K]|uniref:tonB-system energizer ExbB n=1 Tax=Kaistia sp. 32K TaxID=2795690 RepID=UPI001914EF6E|nr:tonB-system energizer ExbB [Kaistia sp. 32K]BCP54657.1 tonB-system energizer ExbB [Kaistia sp. 32K]
MLGKLSRGAALLVAIVGITLSVGAGSAYGQAEAPAIEQAAPPVFEAPEIVGEPGVDRATLPHDLSPVGMYMQADIVVKTVMIGLGIASILTWAIFLSKSLELFAIRHRTRSLAERITHSRSLAEAETQVARRKNTAALLVQAAAEEVAVSAGLSSEGIKERVASRFERIESAAGREMIRGTAILATVGSLSPFIGLFGTVWGIMNSFIGISQANTTNLAVVAPGIAEALFATAIGLVAAIPAVLFYNVFARVIAGNKALIADVAAQTLRLVSRDLDRAEARGTARLAAAE